MVVDAPFGSLSFASVYVPLGNGRDWSVRASTQMKITEYLRTRTGPVVIAGDLNSPRAARGDGDIVPFARPSAVDAYSAEVALMGGRSGFQDAYRRANGASAADHSWVWKRKESGGGYRLDHIFASSHFHVAACRYLHEFREARLSDHSAMLADLAFT